MVLESPYTLPKPPPPSLLSRFFSPSLMESIQPPHPSEGDDARYKAEKELALRFSNDFEFGPHADSELYADLARAFLRCRMRSEARGSVSAPKPHVFLMSTSTMTSEGSVTDSTDDEEPQKSCQEDRKVPGSPRDDMDFNESQREGMHYVEMRQKENEPDGIQEEEIHKEEIKLQQEERQQDEVKKIPSIPLTSYSDDWDLSEEETVGTYAKLKKSLQFVDETLSENMPLKQSPESIPEENSPEKECLSANSVECSSSSSSSMSEDDKEQQEEIVEEMQKVRLDPKTYISSTSTEDETFGEDENQVPLNLLKDFDLMRTQHDQSPSKEHVKNVAMSSEKDGGPLPVPKEAGQPFSSRPSYNPDIELDQAHNGIKQMNLRDYETIGTHDHNSTKENAQTTAACSERTDDPPSYSKEVTPLSSRPSNNSDNDLDQGNRGIDIDRMLSKGSAFCKEPKQARSDKKTRGECPITDDGVPHILKINTEAEKKNEQFRNNDTGETMSPVTLNTDEGRSEDLVGDSIAIFPTSSSDTKGSNFSNNMKDHTWKCEQDQANNTESTSKSPYEGVTLPCPDNFDDTDLFSPQIPTSRSTSFEAKVSEPASSFEFINPSTLRQFEIGSSTSVSTSASRRSKGRKKVLSSPSTVPQPSPVLLGSRSAEKSSNENLLFGTEDAPAFKFNVDLKGGKHRRNRTGGGYKFGKRVDDGKSKVSFTSVNATPIPTLGKDAKPSSTCQVFDGSVGVGDDMDVDEDPMDVDLPIQKPSDEASNIPRNSAPAQTTTKLDANITAKAFSIGSGGDVNNTISSTLSARVHAKMSSRKNRGSFKSPSTLRTLSTGSIEMRQLRNSWSENKSAIAELRKDFEVDETAKARLLHVTSLREEGRVLYVKKKYKESVLKHTAAIGASTNDFTEFPNPLNDTENSELLASLYGNRAAALMMISAYEAAASDCQKALGFIKQNDYSARRDKDLPKKWNGDGGLILMTKLLTRRGRAFVKLGLTNEAQKTFDQAIEVAESSLSDNNKIHQMYTSKGTASTNPSSEMPADVEKMFKQFITDARLNLIDIKRVKSLMEGINSSGGVRADVDAPMAKIKNRQMFDRVNSVLSTAPANVEMVAGKIFCLGSMRKWIELSSFCEKLACQHSRFDGVFTKDLEEFNPFPSVQDAQHLHQMLTSDGKDDENFQPLNPKQVGEAVLRLPYGIVPIYTRALRLEERYREAEKAIAALSLHAEKARPVWSPIKQRQKARYYWLASERDKLRRTISCKNKGDDCYKNAEYQRAAEGYASALKIDGEGSHVNFSCDPWDFETAGGRLHAVLHCNRAACLMALKDYNSAAKECTAALRIENQYMKATLRRARCYMRLERYEECIAEYKTWSDLVEQSRKNPYPSGECNFDRASDVSDRDFKKASAELAEVRNLQRELNLRTRAKAQTQATQNASARRQQWYEQKGDAGARRWDSFSRTNKKKDTKNAQRSTRNFSDTAFSNSHDNDRSPSSSSVTCHYDILQLDKRASQVDIKKAYRKMALKYHPDKNGSSSAAEIFRKVKLAYETLSDTSARKKYDLKSLRQYYS